MTTATITRPVPTPVPVPPNPTADVPSRPSHHDLVIEQLITAESPRRDYSRSARMLFVVMDLLYGRARTMRKYVVLELVARVPYQAWEAAAYRRITRHFDKAPLVRRIHARLEEFRRQQDNEEWHLLIVDALAKRRGERLGWLRFRLMPRLIARGYHLQCALLYLVSPAFCHRLNADFEDHAEHEYATYLAEHPELDSEPWSDPLLAGYGRFGSVADLLRQVMLDERSHKGESEAYLEEPRLS